MKSWIYGFFMTWGMFLVIPCPVRRWDETARGKMMVCLPFIGAVVGGLWALAAWGICPVRGRYEPWYWRKCPGLLQAFSIWTAIWMSAMPCCPGGTWPPGRRF